MVKSDRLHALLKPRLIVFDGDDTLWSTMPLYTAAKGRFARLVATETGISRSEAVQILDRLDARNIKRFGFTQRRFPTSMREAYDLIAKSAGKKPDTVLRRRVYRTGAAVFEQSPRVIRGARLVIKELKRSGFQLVLCTKGEVRLQKRRIALSGLKDLFERIYIVPDKSEAEFRAILHEQRVAPPDAYSVGNSVRSDINPALRIGMKAVWIPNDTWAFERQDLMRTRRVHVAEDLRAVLSILNVSSPWIFGRT